MKKIHRIRPTMSTQEAALELRVSETTVKRLVRRGTLRTTKPKKSRGHWASFVIVDKAFREERHRRLHGLKSPRRKHIPDTDSVQKEFERNAREKRLNEICEQWCKDDPSPIQTVTTKQESELTQSAMLERAENAMNICLEARKDCQCIKDAITRYQNEVDTWAMGKVRTMQAIELSCTRSASITSAACILQLLLAAYYTLCHFNII